MQDSETGQDQLCAIKGLTNTQESYCAKFTAVLIKILPPPCPPFLSLSHPRIFFIFEGIMLSQEEFLQGRHSDRKGMQRYGKKRLVYHNDQRIYSAA